MAFSRRSLLAFGAAGAAVPFLVAAPAPARAEDDPRLTDRFVGKPDAPVTVLEFFSFTCPHCARFAKDTLPRIQEGLIAPGKLKYVYRDYPLDQLALTAAMVARALPQERYEPFAISLLATQDRWAFARGINNTEALWKQAALAGMSRATFEATVTDTKLRDAILAGQDEATKKYSIDSTPSFIFSGPAAKDRKESGEMRYDAFAKIVAEVAGPTG